LKGRNQMVCTDSRSLEAGSGKSKFANAESGQWLNEETKDNNC